MTSMAVAVNGPAKCGKTTFIRSVVDEAIYQRKVIDSQFEFVTAMVEERDSTGHRAQELAAFAASGRFETATHISAGNAFRAAAHYVIERAQSGTTLERFEPQDATEIKKLLDEEGILDHLQNDPAIEASVTTVAAMVGAQAVCEPVFCALVQRAYNAPEGNGQNLIVIDARNPVTILRRHDAIGYDEGQLVPHSVMPVYLDTSVEVAAQRTSGDYQTELARISKRRRDDAVRRDNPVIPPAPDELVSDILEWRRQFVCDPPFVDNPKELHVENDRLTLENIQWLSGFIATAAQDAALVRNYYPTPVV